MPTLTTNPIPHDQIPDAGVVTASAKLLGRQDISGNPTTLEFDIGLILNYIAANLDSTTAAALTAALTQYHKKGDVIADTDIPSAIARDSEVSAAITAALVGYLTQAAGDARYPLLSGLPEAIDDRVGALLVAGANITLAYNDTTNTLTIASSASGGGGGHIVQDETTNLTQRSKLAFVGAGVSATDDVSGDRTVVTIPGGGAANFLSLPLLGTDPGAIANQTLLFARADGNPYIRTSDGTVYPLTLGASVPPIGGGTGLQDDFNAADGTAIIGRTLPGSSSTWVRAFSGNAIGPVGSIQGNAATDGTGATAQLSTIVQIDSTSYTLTATFTLGTLSFSNAFAFFARADVTDDNLIVQFVNNLLRVYACNGVDTFVQIGSDIALSLATGTPHTATLDVSPTALICTVNGTQVLNLANTAKASNTMAGFAVVGSGFSVDSWSAT